MSKTMMKKINHSLFTFLSSLTREKIVRKILTNKQKWGFKCDYMYISKIQTDYKQLNWSRIWQTKQSKGRMRELCYAKFGVESAIDGSFRRVKGGLREPLYIQV